MNSEIIVALCSLAGTLLGTLGGIAVSSRLTNYRLEQLEHKVDKHNKLVERMAVAERDIRAHQGEISALSRTIKEGTLWNKTV